MSLGVISCLCLTFFVGALAAEKDKIVGGINANIQEFPYQVSLRANGQHFCGGSIVSSKHVMTAAHCVRGVISPPYSNVAVVTGSTMSTGSTGKSYRVVRADVHHGYLGTQQSSYHNDIAILTLASPITFDGNTRQAQLPTRDVQYGDSATVSGWGIRKYPSQMTSPVLQKAPMTIIPASSCSSYLSQLRIYNEQVCAMQRKGVGACSGDSGGPLSVNGQVVGIASWVIPCGEGFPDVYTKVYAYRDWIKGIISRA